MSNPSELVGNGFQASAPDEDTVRQLLATVIDPELGEDIVSLGMIRSISLYAASVHVEVALTIAGCPLRNQLEQDVRRVLESLSGIEHVSIGIGVMDKNERAALMSRARRLAQERGVKSTLSPSTRILGIVSGKGGVGKSSVSVNLAVALANRGFDVGILDADIWGFSVPRMLGVQGPLEVRSGKMLPIERRIGEGNLKIVSMGFLSDEDEAIMWRGLVLNRALQHFIEDVDWGELDYLVIDMPPGTGDVQMGLARMLSRTELLVVTTPALAAQKVAGRAADMARKGHLRVAGVIENMAGFTCEHGEHYDLFGSGGGERLAREISAPLIGSIPIDPNLARGGDLGEPVASGSGPVSDLFAQIAQKIATEIAPIRPMEGCSARMIEALDQAMASSFPEPAPTSASTP